MIQTATLLASCSLLCALLTGPATAREGEDPRWYEGQIAGDLRTEWSYRSLDGDDDLDFYNYWNLRGDDFLGDHLDLYFSGRLNKDLDGTSNRYAEDPFVSIEDAEDGWESQVYELYADLHDPDDAHSLRLGREYIDYADWIHSDGANVRLFRKSPVSVSAFIGRPVSYYSPTSGEWTGGGAIETRLWEGNRSRIAYARYENDALDQDDDKINIDTWQRFGMSVRTHARIEFIDNEYLRSAADLIYISLSGDFDAVFGIRHWDGTGQQSRQYSPLFRVLGELEPYTYLTARFTKSLTPWLAISPGAAGRIMDSDNRDSHNREYGRYDLTFIVEPAEPWSLSLCVDYWDIRGGDEFLGLTGEIEYDAEGQPWEAAIGTAYLEYEYYQDTDYRYYLENGDIRADYDGSVSYVRRETPDVYTVYARFDYEFSRHLWIRLRGDIEDDSIEDGTAYYVRTSLGVRF